MSRVRVRKSAALFGALALIVLAAGCGGSGSSGSGGNAGSSNGGTSQVSSAGVAAAGAGALPATAPAFIALGTDFGSDQWKQIMALAAKFPGYDSLLAQGRTELTKQGLDFENDVKPALGPEVDLAFLDFKNSDHFVLVTKPSDPAKLDALLQKAKEPPARADVNGYVALASTKTLVDAASSATSHLSDDASFKEAMSALPGGDVIRVFLNGTQVQDALTGAIQTGASGASGLQLPQTNIGKLDWIAAAGSAQSDGVRLDGVVKVEPAPKIATFAADLPNDFASGAIVYAGFANLDEAARTVLDAVGKSQPDLNKQIGQLEAVAGLSLDKDVIPLLKNEGAVAVYPSTEKIPTIVFALKVDDEQKVGKLLDQVGALAQLAGGSGGGATPATVPGYSNAKQVKIGDTSIFYGTANGKLVVSNSAAGLGDLTGSGPKLADDALFKAAKDGAKMPDETTGFAYVDLKTGLPILLGLAQSQGTKVPPAVKQNAAALQSALFYGTTDGSLIRIVGFAGI
jgi:hypothetical protein